MRIAVFIKGTTFHSGYGGLETQNKILCEGLVRVGHDVSVFSPKHELVFDTKYLNGVKYHFIDSVYHLNRGGLNNWKHRSVKEFARRHAETPYDLVVSQSSAGLGVIERKHDFNIPVVSISHGTIIGELTTLYRSASGIRDYLRIIRSLPFVLQVFFGRQRQFIHGSDKVVAVSSMVKDALQNETYVTPSKIEVIFNGIDPTSIELAMDNISDSTSATVSNIVYFGKILKSKGLAELLDVAEDLPANVLIHVIGDGPYLSEFKQAIQSRGLAKHFVIYGRIPYEKLFGLLATLRPAVFAFPTHRAEGLPMSLIESLFLGFPVVAYDQGGVRDVVRQDSTGFLIPPAASSDFMQAVRQLLTDHSLYLRISQEARTVAYEEFHVDAMVKKYNAVFEEVLS